MKKRSKEFGGYFPPLVLMKALKIEMASSSTAEGWNGQIEDRENP